MSGSSPRSERGPRAELPMPETLAAALALAAGTVAYASPIRFDNTAGFQWEFGQRLDVTKRSADQTGLGGDAGTFALFQDLDSTTYYIPGYGWYTYAWYEATWVAGRTDSSVVAWQYQGCLRGFRAGVSVSGDLSRPDPSYNGFDFYDRGCVGYSYMGEGWTTYLSTAPVYLAIRFGLADGMHYGWIGVRCDWLHSYIGPSHLTPFAWGFETRANTPIATGAIPAPGTIAALVFGAAAGAGASRPRRKQPA